MADTFTMDDLNAAVAQITGGTEPAFTTDDLDAAVASFSAPSAPKVAQMDAPATTDGIPFSELDRMVAKLPSDRQVIHNNRVRSLADQYAAPGFDTANAESGVLSGALTVAGGLRRATELPGFREWLGNLPLPSADDLNRASSGISDANAMANAEKYGDPTWANRAANTTSSIVQNLPGMAVGGVLSAPSRAAQIARALVPSSIAGYLQGSSSLTKAKDAGLSDSDALGYAVSQGTAEAVPEIIGNMFGAGTAMSFWKSADKLAGVGLKESIKEAAQKGIMPIIKEAGKDLGVEQLTEGATTLMQRVADKLYGIDPSSIDPRTEEGRKNLMAMATENFWQVLMQSVMMAGPGIAGQIHAKLSPEGQARTELAGHAQGFIDSGIRPDHAQRAAEFAVSTGNTDPSGIEAVRQLASQGYFADPSEIDGLPPVNPPAPDAAPAPAVEPAPEADRIAKLTDTELATEMTKAKEAGDKDAYVALLEADSKRGRVDSLTQLVNRRHEAVQKVLDQGHRAAYIDLDFFKKINDTYGHAEGDRVLREIGKIMNEEAAKAPGVTAARVGGEEMILALPEDGSQDGVADIIHQRIANEVKVGPEQSPVTASIGLASGKESAKHDAKHRGDALLYVAKGSGRNQIHVAPVDGSGIVIKRGPVVGEKKYVKPDPADNQAPANVAGGVVGSGEGGGGKTAPQGVGPAPSPAVRNPADGAVPGSAPAAEVTQRPAREPNPTVFTDAGLGALITKAFRKEKFNSDDLALIKLIEGRIRKLSETNRSPDSAEQRELAFLSKFMDALDPKGHIAATAEVAPPNPPAEPAPAAPIITPPPVQPPAAAPAAEPSVKYRHYDGVVIAETTGQTAPAVLDPLTGTLTLSMDKIGKNAGKLTRQAVVAMKEQSWREEQVKLDGQELRMDAGKAAKHFSEKLRHLKTLLDCMRRSA